MHPVSSLPQTMQERIIVMNTRDPNVRVYNETTNKSEERGKTHESSASGSSGYGDRTGSERTSFHERSYGGGSGEKMEHAREKAYESGREMIGGAKETGKKMLDQAQDRARSAFTSQRDRAVGGLNDIADTFRQVGNQLRENERDSAARYADRFADRVEHFADMVRDRDMDELLHNARDMARRRPGMFMGGAFILGFMAARFLKSSRGDSGATRRRSFHGDRTTHFSEGGYSAGYAGGGRYAPTESGRYAETHASPEKERVGKVREER